VGGLGGVTALIKDLYRRIEQDEVLRVAFPHFNSGDATSFFLQWFGGSRGYSDDLAGGLLRRHQHRYISPKAAAAWLRCMREALVGRGLDVDPIMRPLSRIAKAMIHSPETDPEVLRKGCDAVQDAAQVQFETLLNDAAKGRTENVRKALEKDQTIASRRGMDNRTLAWVATYKNRPKLLELTLKAGGDCNTPACDPLHATMACDVVHMGTGVAVTPLAIAKKWQPALVAPLVEHGAIDDVFTTAWLGDLPALLGHLERHPELVHASDPADDFQEVSLLCHAVCGGSIDAVKLLLERGALVTRHMWGGVSLAATLVLCCGIRGWNRKLYGMALFATVCLMAWTSDQGGKLTHGEGFLTEHMPAKLRALLGVAPPAKRHLTPNSAVSSASNLSAASLSAPAQASVAFFASRVAPIFDDKCVQCHGHEIVLPYGEHYIHQLLGVVMLAESLPGGITEVSVLMEFISGFEQQLVSLVPSRNIRSGFDAVNLCVRQPRLEADPHVLPPLVLSLTQPADAQDQDLPNGAHERDH